MLVKIIMVGGGKKTCKFIPTNNGHDAERLDTSGCRLKGLPPGFAARVAEDDKGVDLGIQVGDALVVGLDGGLERGDGLGVLAAAAAGVVFGGAVLETVAVDVGVGEVGAGAFDVDYVEVGFVVAAVGEVWGGG